MVILTKETALRFITQPRIKRLLVIGGIITMILGLLIAVRTELVLALGLWGLFAYSLIGPATVLIPTFSLQFGFVVVAVVAAVGMAINDSVGWIVGKNADVFVSRPWYVLRAEWWLKRYGIVGLFLFSVIPFPYDFVAVVAGYVEIPFGRYITTIFFARLIRFLILGSGAVWFFQ